MKKILLALLAVFTMTCAANAQKGSVGAGVDFNFGTKISNVGFGAKLQYGFTNNIRGEVSFKAFFEAKHQKVWDLNFNGHYLIKVAPKMNFYPIAGLTILHDNAGDGFTRVGANIGAGLEYYATSDLSINLEAKGQLLKDFSQAVVGIGATYHF